MQHVHVHVHVHTCTCTSSLIISLKLVQNMPITGSILYISIDCRYMYKAKVQNREEHHNFVNKIVTRLSQQCCDDLKASMHQATLLLFNSCNQVVTRVQQLCYRADTTLLQLLQVQCNKVGWCMVAFTIRTF